MGRDWFSQGQLELAAAVLATAVLATTGLATTGLAAAGLARAAAASGNKTDKDAATMARGGIRRTRRRGLVTGVSFIEPSLDSIAGRFHRRPPTTEGTPSGINEPLIFRFAGE
jgi:hypothetical protein